MYHKRNIKLKFIHNKNENLSRWFHNLNVLKDIAKSLKRDDELVRNFLQKRIKTLRKNIKAIDQSYYVIEATTGKQFIKQFYNELPDPYSFKETFDTLVNDIKRTREQRKRFESENKSFMGFNYVTEGGVFKTFSSIKKLEESHDPYYRLGQAKIPHSKMKANYVGIELEFYSKINPDIMRQMFVKEKLQGFVYPKSDSSIRPEERGEQGHELTILCRQEDAQHILKKVSMVLNSSEVNAKVNNSCGFHLHIDMRNRDPVKAYHNLVFSLPLLNQMIPQVRLTNKDVSHYCKQNETSNLLDYYPDMRYDIKPRRDNRYQAINPVALSTHKTLEVRLHSGTTNAKKIYMWTKLCAAIADAEPLANKLQTVEDLESYVIKDEELSNYIKERIALFNKDKSIDTKSDSLLDSRKENEVG